jgi:hypothetical protein
MESFLLRKKRKLSPEPNVLLEDDDEPTDIKLAILSSLYPKIEQDALLDILLAHDGSVSEASASLKGPNPVRKSSGVIGSQMSMRSFAISSGTEDGLSPTKKRLMSKKGSTLHLYDPEDVAEHTPCTIIHNFLPPDEANDLLREMLEESKSFEKITFKLFDNVVASPHTSGFYVESYNDIRDQKTDYLYNGAKLTVCSNPLYNVFEFVLLTHFRMFAALLLNSFE